MNILKKVCPICLLVSSTWIILLVLRYFGYSVPESLIAMLMGGSAVGISYVLTSKLGRETATSGLTAKYWKLVSIPIGFLAMWLLLHYMIDWFVLTAIAYLGLFIAFRGRTFVGSQGSTSGADNNKIKKIEHELENCC